MELFRIRLLEAMQAKGIRATDLSRETGLSKARISQYVNGKYIPKSDAILSLATVLDVDPLWLMGENVPSRLAPSGESTASGEATATILPPLLSKPIPCPSNVVPLRLCRYPILGEIACGAPIFADEDYDAGYISALETSANFCLIAKGDSMIGARICDGDRVLIEKTDMVNNGEIAAVVVDDDEATLKRLYYYPAEEKLTLMPENPAYKPLTFVGEELNHIHILGRAVAMQARLR